LPDFVLPFKQFSLDTVRKVLYFRIENGHFCRTFGINGNTGKRWWVSLRAQCSGHTSFPSDAELSSVLRGAFPNLIAHTARLFDAHTLRKCMEAISFVQKTHHRVYLSIPGGLP
jgi:hypothetical protein